MNHHILISNTKEYKINTDLISFISHQIEFFTGSNNSLKELSSNKAFEWTIVSQKLNNDLVKIIKKHLLNENIDLKIALRDEHLDLMDEHLTNGGRSIPKLIMRDKETKEVLNTFGPRPSEATKMVEEYKNTYGTLTPEFKKDLQIWYTKDKGKNAVNDLVSLLA